jgi:hypothetical protein
MHLSPLNLRYPTEDLRLLNPSIRLRCLVTLDQKIKTMRIGAPANHAVYYHSVWLYAAQNYITYPNKGCSHWLH